VTNLVAAGIPREQINLAGTGASVTAATPDNRAFWEELKDFFLPVEDRYAYAEGLRRGGFVLSVRSDDTNYTRVLDILDRDGALDLDKQEASWRGEGWTGYPVRPITLTQVKMRRRPRLRPEWLPKRILSALSSSETTASPRMATATSGTDEVIPVYEEQLRVGNAI
jgi:hypothetical protein